MCYALKIRFDTMCKAEIVWINVYNSTKTQVFPLTQRVKTYF